MITLYPPQSAGRRSAAETNPGDGPPEVYVRAIPRANRGKEIFSP